MTKKNYYSFGDKILTNILIYGANGYTAKLTIGECLKAGIKPILAGRNLSEVQKVASDFKLDCRIFSLKSKEEIRKGLDGLETILNCAGPFSQTAGPIIEVCLEKQVHYFDITGEIAVFELAHSFHNQAVERGIIICPGIGFDVVPTDCLALMLKEQFKFQASNLELAFHSEGGPSKGTALTSLAGSGSGTKVRREGKIVTVPYSTLQKDVAFPHKTLRVNSIPWGDVFTAYISTQIPNITVYIAMHPKTVARMKKGQKFFFLRNIQPFKWFLKRQVKKTIPKGGGPTEEVRKKSQSMIWGFISDEANHTLEMFLRTPNGYDLTALSSVKILSKIDSLKGRKGYFTPSTLLGSKFILEIPGCELLNK